MMAAAKLNTLDSAFIMLARRDYSEYELSCRLAQKGHSTEAIFEAIEYLKQHQYIDDQALCHKLIEKLQQSGKWGIRGIIRQLAIRGIPEQIIRDEAVAVSDAEELSHAVALLKKRYTVPDCNLNKAGRYLMTRGFSVTIIEQALEYFIRSQ